MILNNDPNKIPYLYKAELWEGNIEAFESFKKKYLRKIFNTINELNTKSKQETPDSLEIKDKITQLEDDDAVESEQKYNDEVTLNDIADEIYSQIDMDTENIVSSYIDDDICNEILKKFSNKKISIDNPDYNKYKKCFEKNEISKLEKSEEKLDGIYPQIYDPNFQKKITLKREFYENKYDNLNENDIKNIEEKVDELCNKKIFELSPHQVFVKISCLNTHHTIVYYYIMDWEQEKHVQVFL